jgi:putative SOS response-associated peptidase YedK
VPIGIKDGAPYAFAGLWERWRDPQTEDDLLTFSIITTDPNQMAEPLLNRMPMIIAERDYHRWLGTSNPEQPPINLHRPLSSGGDDRLEGR